jgi:hypothetical protein
MKIKGSTLFGRQKNGKYPHNPALDEEYEEMLAAIMLEENRDMSSAFEVSLKARMSYYKQPKRDDMIEAARQKRKEDENQ